MNISRRFVLGSMAALGAMPLMTAQAQTMGDRKFVFIMLRGAMDGLAALIPDDAEMDALRASVLPSKGARLDLGNGFRLHPSLTHLNGLYNAGQASFVHAASTRIRSRSHFKAQDALEILGGSGTNSGWLNRALHTVGTEGLGIGYSVPLALVGPARVANWAPPVFPDASAALLDRVEDLYANDPLFSEAYMDAEALKGSGDMLNKRGNARRFDVQTTRLGEFMSADNGPNVGMVSLGGWDTHANQANRLNNQFKKLDDGIAALKTAMGESWDKTCVLVCSEFGRTARANGTKGTDHGTGGLTMLLGGAVKGGQILGDWPGLRSGALYQGRDLYPANAIESIVGGVLRDHMALSRGDIYSKILPETQSIMSGLIR